MVLAKIILFNLYWLITVKFGLSDFVHWLLLGSILLFLSELKNSDKKRMKVLLTVLILGVSFDALAQKLGLVQFYGDSVFLIPTWLVTLWFLFSWIAPELVFKFKDRPKLFLVLSAIFGPLSYFWGIGFMVLKIDTYLFYIVYAVFWSLFMYSVLQYLHPKELINANKK